MDVLQLSVTHYNNELGEVVEYEMLDPQCLAEMTPLFGARPATTECSSGVDAHEQQEEQRGEVSTIRLRCATQRG